MKGWRHHSALARVSHPEPFCGFVHTLYKYSVDKSIEAMWNDSGTIFLSSWRLSSHLPSPYDGCNPRLMFVHASGRMMVQGVGADDADSLENAFRLPASHENYNRPSTASVYRSRRWRAIACVRAATVRPRRSAVGGAGPCARD
jgi:hypothetical protein